MTAKYVNETGALCPSVDIPTQVLDLLQEAINAEDLTIGEDMYLAINAAAHECFDYVSFEKFVEFNNVDFLKICFCLS